MVVVAIGRPVSTTDVRVVRVDPRLLTTWIVVVFVPLVYLFMLPGLASVDPFGTHTFAAPLTEDDHSISAFLKASPANGGFAVFTSPAVGYAWLNPIARRSCATQLAAGLLTVGWALSILLPLGFAASAAHQAAFFIGTIGTIAYGVALLTSVRPSGPLWALFALLLVSIVASLALFRASSVAFLVFEYITAVLTLLLAPVVNLLGVPIARRSVCCACASRPSPARAPGKAVGLAHPRPRR